MGIATLTFCLIGFLATLLLTLAVRLAYGASWSDLFRNRCYEVVPLRGLFWIVLGLAWAAFLTDVVLFVARAFALVFGDQRPPGLIVTVLITGLLAWPLHRLRLFVQRRLVDLPRIEPPEIKLGDATFRVGIDAEDFSDLGSERFPNHVAPNRHVDQRIRGLLLFFAALVVVVLISLYNGHSERTGTTPSEPVATTSELVRDLGLFLLITSATLLIALLRDNRDYTFVPFRAALVLKVMLGSTAVLGALLMEAHPPALYFAVGAVTVGCAIRLIADVRASWRYDRMKKVYNPIADRVREYAPYLPQLPVEPGFRLPALSVDALHHRISQGCKNVEERGLFVTRHFGRFLDLLEVEYQDCAMAMLRYLTWRRYMTLGPGFGTWDVLRYPEVPWWNLEMFPLHGPRGYAEWTDPLGLGTEWDVVVVCGTCGGSGVVTRTVSETQNGQTVTKTVTETCGGCGGSGRLRHQQILNTQWQRLLPLVTHPDMRVPELVEDAEDVTYVRVTFVEERQRLPLQAKTAVPRGPMLNRILQTVQQVASLHDEHTEMVEKLHDGHLYRADFQVCGYRTIRIRFQRLRGRLGWFFGKRPEFYFPRLPLSWSALCTCAFLPTLAAALGLGVVALVGLLFQNL